MPPNNMPPAASARKSHSGVLIFLLVFFILLFFGAVGFGIWAYGNMLDYKNNTDQKVAAAVQVAQKQTSDAKDKEFVDKYKYPYDEYDGPANYGSVKILYPKTWSAYVDEKAAGSSVLDGYMHPGFVPGTSSGTSFALHIEVVNQQISQQLKQFDGKVKSGKVKISPYVAKQVPGVLGSRVDGEINTGQHDVMVLLPIRDKTLKISTQSTQFVSDFDNIIMANLKFVP